MLLKSIKNNITKEFIYGNKKLIPNKNITTKDTLYDIASLTKVFTSTLIYMTHEENLINKKDYVYNIDSNYKYLKNIKIIDLLSHNQNIWTKGYLGDAKK